MSVSKFRFVSPGVYVNEIDNSQLPRAPEEMGPVVIGRSLFGPMMRPVRVTSAEEFQNVFGKNVPGGRGGDVWRNGNTLTPTYGTYAANAYLRSSSPVTFIRLGGYQYLGDEATTGLAGWETTKAYGLFAAPLSGSGMSTKVSGSAPLIAIIYSSGSVGLSGKSLLSAVDDTHNATATWVKVANNNLQVNVVLNSRTSSVNFDSTSDSYARSVLNTTPSQYSTKKYFLGETFSTWAVEKLGNISNSENYAVIALELKDHSDFRKNASDANDDDTGSALLDNYAGWVVSQHKGAYNEMTPSGSTGIYPDIQPLFKLIGLSEGEWNSQNLKVCIEDIKLPVNSYVKHGTFSVAIRNISSNDSKEQPAVEVFTNLTLDPSSENYIARRIGDKYSEWDYSKKAFISYGLYDNRSRFVRVQMNNDVDNAYTDPSLLPFGYYGPVTLVTGTLQGATSLALTDGFLSGNTVACASSFTASFVLPQVPNLTTTLSSSANSFATTRWGFKTDISKFYNQDVVDLVRSKPVGYATLGSAKISYLFSLDDLSGTVSSDELDTTEQVSWEEGNRAAGESLTTVTGGFGGISGLLDTFNKFSMPLVGGFDGLDITKPDPFSNNALVNGTEQTNYAYNSIKVAIESISDPEVVEMNLACIPGVSNENLTTLLMEKCEARGDALAIVDLDGDYNPEATTPVGKKPNLTNVINNLKNRNLNTSYGCTYFPWVNISDNDNAADLYVPPSVVALGTFSSSQKRSELWFAPAGFNRGGLSNGSAGYVVKDTALHLTSKDRDSLYENNINPIAAFTAAEGIVIYGQKTLQVTPSALDRINVRRLMIYLKKEISRMASTVLFDPNVQVTWNRFLGQAEPFLANVRSRFGLSDYRIILDETTTTADLVDRNIVYAKILLKPTRAIEFIALDFVLAPTGASFND